MKAIQAKENRAKSVNILRIEVIPNLTIPIDGPSSVDIDVVASQLEEGSHILENKSE